MASLGPGTEFDRIRAIVATLGSQATGVGDDCALIGLGSGSIALSIDAVVDTVHFRRDWLTPDEIGFRAAAAAMSDLAAVGAEVTGVLVALTLPQSDLGLETDLLRGVGSAAAAVGGHVLGGDLTAGPVLSLAITAVGMVARPVRRSGARAGDGLWVTGTLGGARAALAAWSRSGRPDPGARTVFATPTPRIDAGRWAAQAGATAMIDLSDGLAGDAAHLAAAGVVDVEIELDLVPIGPGVVAAAAWANESPRTFAARGGEDYELLVALPPGTATAECPVALTRVGQVSEGPGQVRLTEGGRATTIRGYDHFS